MLSGGFLNTFVFHTCGKVSLILSFYKANASSTSSRVLGQVEQSLRLVQITHSPLCFKCHHYLWSLFVLLAGSLGAPSQSCLVLAEAPLWNEKAAWRKSNHILFDGICIVQLPRLSLWYIFPHASA